MIEDHNSERQGI